MKNLIYGLKENQNTSYFKPIEDHLGLEADRGLFVICDGVSRDKPSPGNEYPNPSPSAMAAQIAVQTILAASMNLSLQAAVVQANNNIGKQNAATYEGNFPPGTTALAVLFEGNQIRVAHIGDCILGVFSLDGHFRQLTASQTAPLYRSRDSGKRYSANDIRQGMCNVTSHPLSYGVLDGNQNATHFIETLSVLLRPGDTVVMMSDGLEMMLEETHLGMLRTLPFDEIIQYVELLEGTRQKRSDDKAMIRFVVE
jgi:serine/threonine protein phosphatase PrpC